MLRRYVISLAISFVILLVFYVTTEPGNLPLVLTAFSFIGLFVFGWLLLMVIQMTLRYEHRAELRAAIGAGGVTIVLGLRSLNQLSLLDGLLVIVFCAILAWYVGRS